MKRPISLAVIGLAAASPCLAHADNGAFAPSQPVRDIVIDGDLGDWPKDPSETDIAYNAQGERRPGDDDFSARFRSGYDLESGNLYVAIVVRDDTHHIEDAEDSGWSEQDGVILYLDPTHSVTGSGAALFSVSGPHRRILTPTHTWDATVKGLDWDDAEVAVVRTGDTTTYEWRIRAPKPLVANRTLGLDFLVTDHDGPEDEGGNFSVTWGPGFGKSLAGGRNGDLLLVDPAVGFGRLTGELAMAGSDAATEDDLAFLTRHRVRLVNDADPALWVQVEVDDDGRYDVELPPGSWRADLPFRTFGDPWDEEFRVVEPGFSVSAVVTPGETATAPTLVSTFATPPSLGGEPGRLFRFDAAETAELEGLVGELMTHYNVPGVSLALVKDGKLAYHGAFGTKNAFDQAPVTPETLFEAASITKIVFAFAVNRMAERGEIDLDKPLYEYLPFEDLAYDERYKKITARHALSHQSGMPNWRWQNDDGQIDLKFYPGIQFGYSGEGYEYLGRVVAHITSKPLEQVLMEEVQTPMGFTERTFFSDSDALRAVASRGHWSGYASPHNFAGEPGMAHSMITEAGIFSNFMISLIERKGLSPEGYEAMLEPQVAVINDGDEGLGWPERYGLGFNLKNSPHGLVWGHGGNNGDFVCMFEIYDEHDSGWIVFTNGHSGIQLVDALREYLIIGDVDEGTEGLAME